MWRLAQKRASSARSTNSTAQHFHLDGFAPAGQWGRLQIKLTRPVSPANDFVSYVDALGQLDGTRSLIEWKTTSTPYPEAPDGLLALDRQPICSSWLPGLPDLAEVVFVRPR